MADRLNLFPPPAKPKGPVPGIQCEWCGKFIGKSGKTGGGYVSGSGEWLDFWADCGKCRRKEADAAKYDEQRSEER
jgi:hypothetical protein